MADEVQYFLGAVFGEVYYGREFVDLPFDSSTLAEFKRAGDLYHQRNYDACIQAVWRMFELTLKQLFDTRERRRVNITDLIVKAGEENILAETEVALTQALYKVRCVSEHGHLKHDELLIAKGLLIASIPLLSNLKHGAKAVGS